jgi:hypothetical protein
MNDVLLEADEAVGAALDGGLGEHPVVSWNDAADSHESVASDALVMPIMTGTALGRGLAS